MLAAAELTSRIDDAVFSNVPLLANPDRAYDLTMVENGVVRGRPGGAFRKWQLNNHGFPGQDIALAPTAMRVMTLGASETFGVFESKGHTFPDLLGQELKRRQSDVEVVNAALPGMSLASMVNYWRSHASRYAPHFVLIYPSPEFYLDRVPPQPAPRLEVGPLPPPIASRFADRLYDHIRQIPLLRLVRGRAIVGQAVSEGGPDFLFGPQAPPDRVEAFQRDLEVLAGAIAESGSTPVLVTHAFFARDRVEPDLRELLEYFRIFYPRAEAETFLAFSAAAREAVLATAKRRSWAVIDAADALSGRHELFADPVHFNDKGSQRMAEVLAAAMADLVKKPRGGHLAVQ